MKGVFCANFATPRLLWKPCGSVWHGRCYTPHPDDHFYYHVVTDADGFDWRPRDMALRYKEARDGDNLLTTFQCDLCWFRNLQLWDPLPNHPQDQLLLCVIRRASLDSLWGREPQTVTSTLRAARNMVQQWEKVGLSPQFPPLGPFPVRDSLGMGVAVAMLLKSLEPGCGGREPQTVTSTLRAARNMVQQWEKVGLSPQFPPLGPFPVRDSLGMGVAVAMLLKSLEPGRYSSHYQQFATVQKLRAGFSNI
jgi:hypothetical protein